MGIERLTMTHDTDVAIVGSGFSGLGMAIRLKQAGSSDFVVLERAGEVGGTWQANTYPGCACDVPSHLYSFSFAPNPEWTQTYSTQPEIWTYLRRTADDFGVRVARLDPAEYLLDAVVRRRLARIRLPAS
jgi:cation diffusion facilitator CzcD-associated flavoprotein CzcO